MGATTNITIIDKPLQRVLAGFIRMHVLHHAAERQGLYGNWMIEELRHHGYNISAGTLYPMLRTMEKDGWITGRDEEEGSQRRRRLYGITPKGRVALKEVRARLRELFDEVGAVQPRRISRKGKKAKGNRE